MELVIEGTFAEVQQRLREMRLKSGAHLRVIFDDKDATEPLSASAEASSSEAELIREIQQDKRPGFQARFDDLNTKRRAFTLTPAEHDELKALIAEAENFDAQRIGYLTDLSEKRQTSLPDMMHQLGLKAPDYA